jgi:hypothetical protein
MHECCLAAKALGDYFRENRVKVAGTVRAIALGQERVLERYESLRQMMILTETRQELASTVNAPIERAHEFLASLPDGLDVISTNVMRILPPYAELTVNQMWGDWRAMTPVFPHYRGGKAVKVKDGDVRKFRILRNVAKWKNENNHTREELNEQIKLAEQWLDEIKPKFG